MTESGLGLPRKMREIGTMEKPLRGGSESIRSVRAQLATVFDALRHCVCHEICMARNKSRNKQLL